jgi:DNA-directed RNA polymerase subunit RPC12/RpoP
LADEVGRRIDEGLNRAARLGHDMQVKRNNGRDDAMYVCSRCGLAFRVGYRGSELQLITDAACTIVCGESRP